MARATPKKANGGVKSAKTADISSFFKPPSAKKSNGKALNASTCDDIKPSLFCSNRESSGNVKPGQKGKEKAVGGDTSADPVVISSDEEGDSGSRPKKQKTVASPTRPVEVLDSSPGAGPSRLGSCSPPVQAIASTGPPAREDRPAFAGVPDFESPPSWPNIINTAIDLEEEYDDGRVDGDENNDADSQHPGMFEEDDDVAQVSEDEQGVVDGDEVGNRDMNGDDQEADALEAPTIEQPENENLAGTSRGGSIDLTMEWDEGDDEGMGMEEPDDYDDPPNKSAKRLGTKGGGEKVNKCPVCSQSMKGKKANIIESHINACLDSSARKDKSRPITSIGHTFSPAPSSPSPPPETAAKGPNAFSVLMSGHKEKAEWKTAEDDLRRDGKRTYGRRPAPFYKVMTGMPVAVDAFRYGAIPKVNAYLLTHAHSDHYTNLSKSWVHGPIYCSQTTANLIVHMLGVEPKWVHGLPDNIPFEMPNTGGVTVTPLEANHCPGSSIFLFEGRQTVNAGDSTIRSPYVGSKRIFRYLHCGDFRANPKMVLHPAIARAKIDTCYLDTTYLNPKYCFPPQPQVIEACANLARRQVLGISETAPPLDDNKDEKPDLHAAAQEEQERSKEMMEGWLVKKEEVDVKLESKDGVKEELVEVKPKTKGRTLVVMGTYSIGKERIVKAVARVLGSTIYCDPRKKGILLCETDPELHSMISSDPIASQVHLLPLGNIQLDRLQDYLVRLHPHFDRVLGFRPTGWSYSPPAGTDMLPDVNAVIKRDQSRTFTSAGLQPQRGSCRQFMMYGVPYSEHSSFFELTCFALSLPGPDLRMIATVNVGNEKSRAKMKKWFEKWSAEKARRKEKNLPSIVDYRDETYW